MKKSNDTAIIQQNVEYFSDDFKILVQDATTMTYEKAFHEALEIKYFYEGRSLVMIDSDIIIAESGDITVVNPYELHSNITNDVYTGKYLIMMVDLDFFVGKGINAIDLRQLLLVKKHRFNHYIKNNKALQHIMIRIKEELDGKKEYYQLIVSNLLCEFFVLLIRCSMSGNTYSTVISDDIRKNNVISPALEKIFRDYASAISVDELAQLCNISKYHFCRVFKQQMGMTVTQYIINYRISLAESMLKDKTHGIRDIAASCGFGDLSYFYQCYKRIKGTPPGKARD